MSGVALRPGVVKQYTYLGWGPNSTQAYCTQVLLLRMINMNRALVPTTCIPHWIWRMHRTGWFSSNCVTASSCGIVNEYPEQSRPPGSHSAAWVSTSVGHRPRSGCSTLSGPSASRTSRRYPYTTSHAGSQDRRASRGESPSLYPRKLAAPFELLHPAALPHRRCCKARHRTWCWWLASGFPLPECCTSTRLRL